MKPITGTPRAITYLPLVPKKDGQAPAWIIRCVQPGCTFAHDAHGATEAEALLEIQPLHASHHKLVAQPVEYADHPLYR